jgi:uncharacterized protein (TIGR03067 family)
MFKRGLLMLTAVLLVAADTKEDAAKGELKKLAGDWKVASAEKNGKADEGRAKAKLSFDGERLTITTEGRRGREYFRVQLDPAKKPKTIDIRGFRGTIHAIYTLDGDSLKLCWEEGSSTAPKEFSTKDGKDQSAKHLLTAKREKSEKK